MIITNMDYVIYLILSIVFQDNAGIFVLICALNGTAFALTDATEITMINGEAPDDRLHTTPQCNNCDVNNDGYDDVIAGAWGNDAGGITL